MTDESIDDYENRAGKIRSVRHADGALDSFHQAVGSLRAKKAIETEGYFIQAYETLINQKRLPSPSIFKKEGKLPNRKHFQAITYGSVRAYCWWSVTVKNQLVVSHYVFKDQPKLAPKDTKRACKNWNALESK